MRETLTVFGVVLLAVIVGTSIGSALNSKYIANGLKEGQFTVKCK